MQTVEQYLEFYKLDYYIYPQLVKHLQKKVVKEFSIGGFKPWISWQNFGTHKNVKSWIITDDGYAIGFNENPTSVGWSFPVKKLTRSQIISYIAHELMYEEVTGSVVFIFDRGAWRAQYPDNSLWAYGSSKVDACQRLYDRK